MYGFNSKTGFLFVIGINSSTKGITDELLRYHKYIFLLKYHFLIVWLKIFIIYDANLLVLSCFWIVKTLMFLTFAYKMNGFLHWLFFLDLRIISLIEQEIYGRRLIQSL